MRAVRLPVAIAPVAAECHKSGSSRQLDARQQPVESEYVASFAGASSPEPRGAPSGSAPSLTAAKLGQRCGYSG